MILLWSQRNNSTKAFDLPLGDGLLASRAPFEKDFNRHGESHFPHAYVDTSVPRLIGWALIQKNRQSHEVSPRFVKSERTNCRGARLSETLTKIRLP
jgi:hypothetical protein